MTPLFAQFGKPTGPLGWAIARIMAVENAPDYEMALALLGPQPGETLIEVGPGIGAHVPPLLARGVGYIGVDHSPYVVAEARLATPSATWLCADICAAPELPKADCALAVNTVQWWSDPVAGFVALRDVLPPGGWIAVGQAEKPPAGALPPGMYRHMAAPELQAALECAGFVAAVRRIITPRRPYLLAYGVKAIVQ